MEKFDSIMWMAFSLYNTRWQHCWPSEISWRHSEWKVMDWYLMCDTTHSYCICLLVWWKYYCGVILSSISSSLKKDFFSYSRKSWEWFCQTICWMILTNRKGSILYTLEDLCLVYCYCLVWISQLACGSYADVMKGKFISIGNDRR